MHLSLLGHAPRLASQAQRTHCAFVRISPFKTMNWYLKLSPRKSTHVPYKPSLQIKLQIHTASIQNHHCKSNEKSRQVAVIDHNITIKLQRQQIPMPQNPTFNPKKPIKIKYTKLEPKLLSGEKPVSTIQFVLKISLAYLLTERRRRQSSRSSRSSWARPGPFVDQHL